MYAGGYNGGYAAPWQNWFIREPYAGAWQSGRTECESRENILAFSAVYACVSLICGDISKLRVKLMQNTGAIWVETQSAAFSPVLRRPNRYQSRIQFLSYWVTSLLLFGNAYVLKERDNRGVVIALYVLDPRRVTPQLASDGGVYYRLSIDVLNGVENQVDVPAAEIIHSRGLCLFHPLVGISPIFACGASATQGIRIQANSETFFKNMSKPSGMLTAPATIADDTAARIKSEFESRFGGNNIGRLFVAGDGLKYEPMTMPAVDAQLIEQLRWTVEDVARCFHVPLHKLGMGQPTLNSVAALNQDYYSQCLQNLIESIELDLTEGLALPLNYSLELDIDCLLRMDPLTQADVQEKSVRSGVMSPNEARACNDLPPVKGGESPYLQQQNFSLEALAKRDALPNPFVIDRPTANPTPSADGPPAVADPEDAQAAKAALEVTRLLATFTKELEHV